MRPLSCVQPPNFFVYYAVRVVSKKVGDWSSIEHFAPILSLLFLYPVVLPPYPSISRRSFTYNTGNDALGFS
jgi:hypothetical protein